MNYSFSETPHQSQYLADSTSINAGTSRTDLQNHDLSNFIQSSDTQREALFGKETDIVAQKIQPINFAGMRKKSSLKSRNKEIPSPIRQQVSGGTSLNKELNSFIEDETRMVTFNDEKNVSFGELPVGTPNARSKVIFEGNRINLKDSMNLSFDTSRKLFESATSRSADTQDMTNLRASERFDKYHENKNRLKQENKEGVQEEKTSKSSQRAFTFCHSEESERRSADNLAVEVGSRRLRLSPVNENEADTEQVDEAGNNNDNISSASIENQAERANANNNTADQVENNEEVPGILTEQEGNLYLLRSFTFLLGMIFLLFFTIMAVHGKISSKLIFVTLYVYFAYSAVEIVASSCFAAQSNNNSWRSKEDLFLFLNFISAIFWVGCIDQKLAGNLSVAIIGSIPFLLMVFLYLGASVAPKTVKLKGLLLRIFFTSQSFLIGFKLDDYSDIKWPYALGVFWFYCGTGVVYCAGFAVMLIVIVLFLIFKQRLREEIDLKTELIGHFWYFVYYGCSVLAFIGILSWTRSSNINDEWMKQFLLMSYIGIGVCAFLGLYIFVFYKPFLRFVRIFKGVTSDNERSNRRRIQVGERVLPPKTQVTIEVQKRSSYFVMQSSTYFKPLDNEFFMRSAENMKEIKQILKRSLKQWTLKKVPERKDDDDGKAIKIEVLKESKKRLDRRFKKSEVLLENSSCKLKNKKDLQAIRMMSEEISEAPKDLEFCLKRQLSVDDKYIVDLMMMDIKTEKGKCEDNLCYLCFEKAPNAIFLDCGHGGICYDCGEVIVKKNNECMECRKEIKMICKVEPVVKGSSIIKGIELGTISRTVVLEE